MTGVFEVAHPLIRHHLSRLRDKQTPPEEFRLLIGRLANLLVYEATKDLELADHTVETPLTTMVGQRLSGRIGLVPILRAGLGMVDSVLNLIPSAEVWHLGVYRDEKTAKPVEYYSRFPQSRPVDVGLVLDPMLATGGSAIAAVDILKRWGAAKIRYLGLIAAPERVRALSTAHPDVPIHLAAIDDHLNDKGYIVPGLGDAGDRQFGTG